MVSADALRLIALGAAATTTAQVASMPLFVAASTTACPLRTPVTSPVAASSLMQPASWEFGSML